MPAKLKYGSQNQENTAIESESGKCSTIWPTFYFDFNFLTLDSSVRIFTEYV